MQTRQFASDICAVVAMIIALASAIDPDSAGSIRCGQWSAWESRPWGSARRREGCADGRLDEQCRVGGVVIACHRPTSITASDGVYGGGSSGIVSMPQFNARRTQGENFAYSGSSYSGSSYYYYSTLYNPYYDQTRVTVTCSIGCIVGAAVGSLTAIAFFVSGAIVLYCMCCRNVQRGRVISQGAPGATVIATTSTGVGVYPGTGFAAYSNQSYSQPAQQTMGVHSTAFATAYPTSYPAMYPNAYPSGFPPAYPSSTYPPAVEVSQTCYPPPYTAQPQPPSYDTVGTCNE